MTDEDSFGQRSILDLLAEVIYRVTEPGKRPLYRDLSQHDRHRLMHRAERVRRGDIGFPVVPGANETLGG